MESLSSPPPDEGDSASDPTTDAMVEQVIALVEGGMSVAGAVLKVVEDEDARLRAAWTNGLVFDSKFGWVVADDPYEPDGYFEDDDDVEDLLTELRFDK